MDGDEVDNENDNCPATPNTDQADMDEDGSGDVCDPDADGDEVPDSEDNCLGLINSDQADFDGDGAGDPCDDDDDGDGVAEPGDNCPELANPDQADADSDGTGDLCEAEGVPQIAVVKGVQAFGAWLVGTPYEGAGVLRESEWQISAADGTEFEAHIVWSLATDVAPLSEVRALYEVARPAGTFYARVRYRDDGGWSAYSSIASFAALPLPADDGANGARAGVTELADTFSGPLHGDESRDDNLDRGARFWSPALAVPSNTGLHFTLDRGTAVHPSTGSAARAQTVLALSAADGFAVASLAPEAANDANFDFSFGLRATGDAALHNSYRCKVERTVSEDSVRFNKFHQGVKSSSLGTTSVVLGTAPWEMRCEVVTLDATPGAERVELSIYQRRAGSWELLSRVVDDGATGNGSWDDKPRLLDVGQLVISNEKEGRVAYRALRGGTLTGN